jgi:hypothetical protein
MKQIEHVWIMDIEYAYVSGATTFSLTTLGIMILNIIDLIVTLSINDTQHKHWMLLCWESRFFIVILSVVMLNVIVP